MVSQLKVNEIIKQSGSSITIGETGDTVSGPFTSLPAFEAHSNADQDISDNTYTKVSLQTEIFDSDNKFDNSSNYRFTPTIAGKYFVYGSARLRTDASQLQLGSLAIYKNGSISVCKLTFV